tara:strand:+ start:1076 stop:1318 length:243 start_codon:yes stop_codon:yes gene_type:complete
MINEDLFTSKTIKERTTKPVTLPDGTKTDTWSKEYMLYCEALNLSRKPLDKRRQWLNKLKDQKRVEGLKTWLRLIWKNKN